MTLSAHQQVVSLLAHLKRVAFSDPKRFDEISDQIETITRAYMIPTVGDAFDELDLSHYERRVLEAIAARGGRTVNKSGLMDAVYFDRPPCDVPDIKVIDVFVLKIRRKMRGTAHWIATDFGVGYRYERREIAQ